MRPAITCRNVTKEFGSDGARVEALRGVNLDVYPGEMTLLVGPSGCGKTTLLSVIAGILRPTAGRLNVLDAELATLGGHRLVKFRGQNVGFVFQQFNLLPALTAAENVTVPLIVARWPRRKALARAHALLEKMEMGKRLHHLPRNLSGGEQQRVAIARALIHEPKLLVCDEPTSALDARTGHSIMELLRAVALESGRAVVVVTHDSRVLEFGNRIAWMEDGRITHVETRTPGRTFGALEKVA